MVLKYLLWGLSLLCDQLGIDSVPYLGSGVRLTVAEHLSAASSLKSAINPSVLAEGYVARSSDSSISFKVISNEWLLEYKE